MKKLLLITFSLGLGACMAHEPVALTADQETELATALEGRTAGQTVNCVSQRSLGGNRSVGEGAVLFSSSAGGTVYVNRPGAGCPDLRGRTLVVRTTTGQMCRGDIARVVDPVSRFETGSCVLGDFTPYTRN